MDIRQVTRAIAESKGAELRYQEPSPWVSLLDCIDPDIERAAEKRFAKSPLKLQI